MKKRASRFIAFIAAVIFAQNVAFAGERLDPHKTLLPIYVLPDSAAADGKLDEWAGVPATGSEHFKPATRNTTITPSKSFAPSLRCGMKKGSNDLYFLVIVRDDQQYADVGQHWLEGDYLELYFDFGREERAAKDPEWYKKGNLHTPPGMGQFGFRPRTLQIDEKTLCTAGSINWKVDYASALVEGGIAYEIRLDIASVLDDIKLKELPSYIGIDLGFMDQDYMIRLQTGAWSNDNDTYRLFGDAMDHAWPTNYGMVSCRPIPRPADAEIEPLPRTMRQLFGDAPSGDDIGKAIGKMPNARLADMVTWAGCRLEACEDVVFDAGLVAKLMATASSDVEEKCLAALYFTDQDKEAVKIALDVVYGAGMQDRSPYVLTLANLLNAKFTLGYADQLRKLVGHGDSTAAAMAARALAQIGTNADVEFLKQKLQAISDQLQDRTAKRSKPETEHLSACKFYFGIALETLRARTEPIVIPEFTPVREVLAENTDLERFIPIDGNNVYNAVGLLRTWPEGGPRELWRVDVGKGKSTVVEADGRAFTAATVDGTQWAICLDPLTGKTLWKAVLADDQGRAKPIASPVIDGDRVYFVPHRPGQEQGLTVVCLQAKDGKEIWRGAGDLEHPESCSTPLIVGDVLYCATYSGKNDKFSPLAAVNKMTGEVLWTAPLTARRGAGIASPTYQIIGGIPQVIFAAYGKPMNEVWGVHAETGDLMWRYAPNARYALIPSAAAVGSRVFLCDGVPPFSACLQMYIKDGKIQARQVYRDEKLQCNLYNTVAVLDGAVYGFSNSTIQCTNLADGKLLWKQEGKDWASAQQLIIADGLIFAITTFELIMVEASRTGCKVLGRVKHGVKLGYPQQPTIANGRLYIRGEETVICYDLIKR